MPLKTAAAFDAMQTAFVRLNEAHAKSSDAWLKAKNANSYDQERQALDQWCSLQQEWKAALLAYQQASAEYVKLADEQSRRLAGL